jgi:hypothetical protein
MKKTSVEIVQDEQAPIGAQIIAKAICDIDASTKAILAAGLNTKRLSRWSPHIAVFRKIMCGWSSTIWPT